MYLFDLNLNDNKNIFLVIKTILGIGKFVSDKITKKLGFSKNLYLKMLSKKQLFKFTKIINSLLFLTNNLKKMEIINFKKMLQLKNIKAFRKLNGLPIRGQRTQTNSKTAKKKLSIII